MHYVEHVKLGPRMNVDDVARELSSVRVLGAGRLGMAVSILAEIFGDNKYLNILSLAGPLTAGGLRTVIHDLVSEGLVHALVSSGANVTHDIIEALGWRHIAGSPTEDDARLRKKRLGRIYDILIDQKAFEKLEKATHKMLSEVDEERRTSFSTHELLWEIGRKLEDTGSIIRVAYEKKIPVFCPSIFDSMLGLSLWTFSQLNKLIVNPLPDLTKLVDMTCEARRVGAVILGGGVPKHFTLASNILRGGVDAAIQITLDRPEGGSLSGAPLDEAVSWSKIRRKSRFVSVVGDATILFPIMVTGALQRVTKMRHKVQSTSR